VGETSYVQYGFHGGEWSQTYQGRMDDPHYRISLNACLNFYPTEQGALCRRGGTGFSMTTRGGARGRVIEWDIEESNPYVLEFTDGYLRFHAFVNGGIGPVFTNDPQVVTALSMANPAVVTTAAPHGWSSGNTVMFYNYGTTMRVLQNRQFLITVLSPTTFSIADAITGASINGATLGSFISLSVQRVLELVTPWVSGLWSDIVLIQAENQAVLVADSVQPQLLTMTSPPGPSGFATFSLAALRFTDGPYLDPIAGSIVTTSGGTGNITLTFSFQTWVSTTSYSLGDYVTFSGQGYQSTQDSNLNNTPSGVSIFWTAVNGGAAIGLNGISSGDIGRSIRLFSAPPVWATGTTYSVSNVVVYNSAYYQSIVGSNQGNQPDISPLSWQVVTGAYYAQWVWGRITAIAGGGIATPASTFGSMTGFANAFNGSTAQTAVNSASASTGAVTTYPQWFNWTNYTTGNFVYYNGYFYEALGNSQGQQPASNPALWSNVGAAAPATFDVYAGGHYTSATQVSQVIVYPSSDMGFGVPSSSFKINLWGANALPSIPAPTTATLLGTSRNNPQFYHALTIQNTKAPNSSFTYYWIEFVADVAPPLPDSGSHSYTSVGYLAQIQFFSPNIANGSQITVQLVGPASSDPTGFGPNLLYSSAVPITLWQLGAYSNNAGWPSCGCYDQGRLWLGGAIANRWDSSISDNLTVFSPTAWDGTVADNNGITFEAVSDGVNSTFWMIPDAQGVAIGTENGEWLLNSSTAGTAITPSTVQGNRVTRGKCAEIDAVRAEHTVLVVQRQQRKIMEFFPDVFSGKFSIPNLTARARHLTAPLLEEIRYQYEITPTVWARCGDGSLIACTYKRDTLMTSQPPTIYGWHRHVLGSGRTVESITTGPSNDGTIDALFMVTNDPLTNIRHVEYMTRYFEETDNYANAWLLDDAVTPASYTIGVGGLTINGLWHLNGKTVQAFVGGLDCGMQGQGNLNPPTYTDFTVSNGTITVGYGDGIAAGNGNGLFTQAFCNTFPSGALPIVVGFSFTSQAQLLRPASPAESGARAGPALGKLRRNHRYTFQAVQTNGLSVGTTFTKLDPVLFRTLQGQVSYPLPQLFSGVVQDVLRDDNSFDGMLCWQVTRPVPCIIAAAGAMIDTRDV
jgi:hypothetical protein